MNRSAMDWATLLEPYHDQGGASTEDGQALLGVLIGDEQIEAAVDYYVDSSNTSAEVLRMVFRILQPVAATDRCLDLLWSEAPERQRLLAADLLPVTCRPSNLDAVEALLSDDDPVRQQAALSILFQLQYSLDLDTVPMCRIVRRCMEIGHRHALEIGLQLAGGAFAEITDPAYATEDRSGRLAVEEIEAMFAGALDSDDEWVVEAGLRCPADLVSAFIERIETLATGDGSETATMAQEILDDRTKTE